jgi:hypothetical protein
MTSSLSEINYSQFTVEVRKRQSICVWKMHLGSIDSRAQDFAVDPESTYNIHTGANVQVMCMES